MSEPMVSCYAAFPSSKQSAGALLSKHWLSAYTLIAGEEEKLHDLSGLLFTPFFISLQHRSDLGPRTKSARVALSQNLLWGRF